MVFSPSQRRITRVIGFSVDPQTATDIAVLARRDRRTKSDLFREAWRVYGLYRQQRDLGSEMRLVARVIDEVEQERDAVPVSAEKLHEELSEISSYGHRQARRLGIKASDIPKIVRSHRLQQHA